MAYPDQYEIMLHIGVHKTATTHLQHSVLNRRKALAAAGIQFFGPPQLRNEHPSIASRFDLPFDKGKRLNPEISLTAMFDGGDRLVLSEENFIGSMQTGAGKMPMPLYPKSARRITALAERIALDGIDVFVAIRRPTDFITSAYGQYLLGGHYLPFAKFQALNPLSGVDWVRFVAQLLHARGTRNLIVWRFEDYAAVFPQIMSLMLGETGAEIVGSMAKVVHPGLSSNALTEIDARFAKGGFGADIAATARQAFPISHINPRFDPFDADVHVSSQREYTRQCEAIAGLEGVTFLQPDATKA